MSTNLGLLNLVMRDVHLREIGLRGPGRQGRMVERKTRRMEIFSSSVSPAIPLLSLQLMLREMMKRSKAKETEKMEFFRYSGEEKIPKVQLSFFYLAIMYALSIAGGHF